MLCVREECREVFPLWSALHLICRKHRSAVHLSHLTHRRHMVLTTSSSHSHSCHSCAASVRLARCCLGLLTSHTCACHDLGMWESHDAATPAPVLQKVKRAINKIKSLSLMQKLRMKGKSDTGVTDGAEEVQARSE